MNICFRYHASPTSSINNGICRSNFDGDKSRRMSFSCSNDRAHYHVRQWLYNRFDLMGVIRVRRRHRRIIKVCGECFVYTEKSEDRDCSLFFDCLKVVIWINRKVRIRKNKQRKPMIQINLVKNEWSISLVSCECLLPGVNRKDWSRPDQVVSNDPQYGKGGKPSNENQ